MDAVIDGGGHEGEEGEARQLGDDQAQAPDCLGDDGDFLTFGRFISTNRLAWLEDHFGLAIGDDNLTGLGIDQADEMVLVGAGDHAPGGVGFVVGVPALPGGEER